MQEFAFVQESDITEIQFFDNLLKFNYAKAKSLSLLPTAKDREILSFANSLVFFYNLIVSELSLVSKKLNEQDTNTEVTVLKPKLFCSPDQGLFFCLHPNSFTNSFISSKEGKRFKDAKPNGELYRRALQSQKTILEHLKVN